MNLTARLMVVAVVLTAAGCATRAPVFTPGASVTAPVMVTSENPHYTEEALQAKIQGTVLLNCVVLADGTVADMQVVRSLDRGLDTQAVQALAQWTFEPGTKDGVPVLVRVSVDMEFRLE